MNPYEAPHTTLHAVGRGNSRSWPIGPFLIALLLVLAVGLGGISTFIPFLRAFTMPRFGWVGLILCANPLIFLVPWFWQPTRQGLVGSAFMLCAIGVVNAIQLGFTGTVPVVVNEFTDRMHSSWFWSVATFVAMGAYLAWFAYWNSTEPSKLSVVATSED